jgi:hypothetical protein
VESHEQAAIVEGESGRAVAVRVSPEVDPPGDDPGLKLRGAVAAGAECSEPANPGRPVRRTTAPGEAHQEPA